MDLICIFVGFIHVLKLTVGVNSRLFSQEVHLLPAATRCQEILCVYLVLF